MKRFGRKAYQNFKQSLEKWSKYKQSSSISVSLNQSVVCFCRMKWLQAVMAMTTHAISICISQFNTGMLSETWTCLNMQNSYPSFNVFVLQKILNGMNLKGASWWAKDSMKNLSSPVPWKLSWSTNESKRERDGRWHCQKTPTAGLHLISVKI